MSNQKISFKKVIQSLVVVCLSLVVSYHLQPMLESKPRLVSTFVTIFSILAGFLIAIMIFVVDPIVRKAKSWDELQGMEPVVFIRLNRCKYLFYLYLLSLCLAVAVDLVPNEHEALHKWLQIAFLTFSITVLIASFGLPKRLISIQMEMYNEALKKWEPEGIDNANREVEDEIKRMSNENSPKE